MAHPLDRHPVDSSGMRNIEGLTSDALVSLHDLAATFLDYAGAPDLPLMNSRSLRGVLEGKTREHRRCIFSGLGDWRMVFDGRYKLVLRREEPARLYDTKADPHEMHDVAGREPSDLFGPRISRMGADGCRPVRRPHRERNVCDTPGRRTKGPLSGSGGRAAAGRGGVAGRSKHVWSARRPRPAAAISSPPRPVPLKEIIRAIRVIRGRRLSPRLDRGQNH